jgi:hypothetical protein
MNLAELEAKRDSEEMQWIVIRQKIETPLSPQQSWHYYGMSVRLSREMVKTRDMIRTLKKGN